MSLFEILGRGLGFYVVLAYNLFGLRSLSFYLSFGSSCSLIHTSYEPCASYLFGL